MTAARSGSGPGGRDSARDPPSGTAGPSQNFRDGAPDARARKTPQLTGEYANCGRRRGCRDPGGGSPQEVHCGRRRNQDRTPDTDLRGPRSERRKAARKILTSFKWWEVDRTPGSGRMPNGCHRKRQSQWGNPIRELRTPGPNRARGHLWPNC